jgi:hypothetical protein
MYRPGLHTQSSFGKPQPASSRAAEQSGIKQDRCFIAAGSVGAIALCDPLFSLLLCARGRANIRVLGRGRGGEPNGLAASRGGALWRFRLVRR